MSDAKDLVAKVAGTSVAGAVPTAAITAGGAIANLSGGAAIMKTLAAAGSIVGGGSVAGIAVIGVVSIGVGYFAYRGVKKIMD